MNSKWNEGYTLAGALCLIAVMSIFMALAVQSWSWIKQRENEEELIFRGREYVEAIARYHQKFNSFPPDIETLEKLKFIRKLYKDPMTRSGKWKALRPDSVVETGAAGQINQPGANNNKNGDEEDQDNQPGQIPTGFGNTNGSQTSSSQSGEEEASAEEDKNSDEEPESDTTGPIVGVVSRSKKTSIKVYNTQTTYNKWYFIYSAPQNQQTQPNPTPQKDDKGKQTPPPPSSQQQQQLQQQLQQQQQQLQQQQGTDSDDN